MFTCKPVRPREKVDLSPLVGKSFYKLAVAVVFDMRSKEPHRLAAHLDIPVCRGYPRVLLVDHAVCVNMHLVAVIFGIKGRKKKCTCKDECKRNDP